MPLDLQVLMLHFVKHARVHVLTCTKKEKETAEKGGSGSLHLAGACRPVEDNSLGTALWSQRLRLGAESAGARWPAPSPEGKRNGRLGAGKRLLPESGCSRSAAEIPPHGGKIRRDEAARCGLNKARVMEMCQL